MLDDVLKEQKKLENEAEQDANEDKISDKTFNNHYIANKNVLMSLVGPSGSGKTNTILEYLKRTVYKGYLPFYQVIYFTASTADEVLLNN